MTDKKLLLQYAENELEYIPNGKRKQYLSELENTFGFAIYKLNYKLKLLGQEIARELGLKKV